MSLGKAGWVGTGTMNSMPGQLPIKYPQRNYTYMGKAAADALTACLGLACSSFSSTGSATRDLCLHQSGVTVT